MASSGAAGFAAGVENGQVDESRLFWFPHKTEVWLLGEVQEHHDEGTLTIVSDEGTFEIDSSKLHPYNSSHSEYVEDIAGMNNLHEAPLLDLLRRRFHAEDIYVSKQGQNLGTTVFGLIDTPIIHENRPLQEISLSALTPMPGSRDCTT